MIVEEMIKQLSTMPKDAKVFYRKDSWCSDEILNIVLKTDGYGDETVVEIE